MDVDNSLDIAVVGMACNFPGANNLDNYWNILINGVETIKKLSTQDQIKRQVPKEMVNNPNYVNAVSNLDNIDMFDAEFFGFNPNEATCMDPQQRLFLECCWHAFENAGIDPLSYSGNAAVFAGVAMNSYVTEVLLKNPYFMKSVDSYQLLIGNDKDFLTTQVSYKFNLKGPSVNVNTACSTSLVAIHLARQSLLLGECDVALAGGVSIYLPNSKGYIYTRDSILSPDGHCRAFDEKASGTVWGDGCGVVVLKRLTDAIEDGDSIYAVVKGSAINNDGSLKAGFTAPSANGQSAVIKEAIAVSGISADQISFIETHGTGTAIGDPIEITGLTQAFQKSTTEKQYCPIGSVKTNLGHLNHAAGIAGFIKAVLSVYYKKLPPSLYYQKSNPQIDLNNSPFFVNTKLLDLQDNGKESIYAGISSMGIGGTNSHVVIGQGPITKKNVKQSANTQVYILPLSARTTESLQKAQENLLSFLENHSNIDLESIAYSLQIGRHSFSQRKVLLCTSIEEAIRTLKNSDSKLLLDNSSVKHIDLQNPNLKIAALWLEGKDVQWSDLYKNSKPVKTPLPGYSFDHKRFWVDSIPNGKDTSLNGNSSELDHYQKQANIADWFYLTSWKHAFLAENKGQVDLKKYLILDDASDMSRLVKEELIKTGNSIITVKIGNSYIKETKSTYQISPFDPESFKIMFQDLLNEESLPDNILNFWTIEGIENSEVQVDFDMIVDNQYKGLFNIVNLVKAIEALGIQRKMKLFVFTNSVFDVVNENNFSFISSTIPGVCMVIQQEMLNIQSKVIDFVVQKNEPNKENIINNILNEVMSDDNEVVCAFRGNKRFVKRYDQYSVNFNENDKWNIKENNLYLVYGATEGIGYLISRYISEVRGGKILLLEEVDFPEESQWESVISNMGIEHPLSEKIENARYFINSGGIYLGKISDYDTVIGKIKEAESRYGKIKGVIHGSGASNAKRIETLKIASIDTWKNNFQSVGYSLMLLDKIFNDIPLDFKVMLNSLGSILGGAGFVNVTTIGNMIKSYNLIRRNKGKQCWSIQCWDSWMIEWKTLKSTMPANLFEVIEKSIVTDEEGFESFERSFRFNKYPEVIISATDLKRRYNRWVKKDTFNMEGNLVKHTRPNISVEYEAPKTDVHKKLENVFSYLLGIEKVGIYDDFFELGGHSLLAIQLTKKLEEDFKFSIDKNIIFQNTTIDALAKYFTDNRLVK